MSLISTYQSIKTLLATNLQKKNVSASANEGLTTLVNKIKQVNSFENGVLIKANSHVFQSGNTAKIMAMPLSDDKTVPSASVDFIESDGVLFQDTGVSGSYDESEWFGKEYLTLTPGATGTEVKNEQASDQFLLANKIGTAKTEWSDLADWNNGDVLSFEVVSVTGTVYLYANENISALENTGKMSVPITQNNSYIGFKLEPDAKITFKDFVIIGEKVTTVSADGYGVATYDYVCGGVGLKQFKAKYGSVQSEPCTIYDTLFYDNGGQNVDKWDITRGAKMEFSYPNNQYTQIAVTNAVSTSDTYLLSDISISGDWEVIFECNIPVYANNVGEYFGVRNFTINKQTIWRATQTGWRYYKLRRLNGEYTGFVKVNESDEWESISPQYNQITENQQGQFCFTIYNPTETEHDIQFKNLKIYSI